MDEVESPSISVQIPTNQSSPRTTPPAGSLASTNSEARGSKLVAFAKAHPKVSIGVGAFVVLGLIGSSRQRHESKESEKTSAVGTANAAPAAAAARPTEAQVNAPNAGSSPATGPLPDAQKGWLSYPLLEGDVLWPLAGPIPGRDEFERNTNKKRRSEAAAEVRKTTYLYRAVDEELGEYDFAKHAFPVSYATVTRDGAPFEEKVYWNVCVCSPASQPTMIDGTRLVNETHEWTIYEWGEKRQVVWLPVPEAGAKQFATTHRGHVDVNLLVQPVGVKEDKAHFFDDSRYRENASTGGLIYFKSLGPIRVTGAKGAPLLDTLSQFPSLK